MDDVWTAGNHELTLLTLTAPHTHHPVKKLVILKEVVCNQSKMKLNDMVSKIGQYQTSLVSTQLDLKPLHINSNNVFKNNNTIIDNNN